jgi:hypothetical protein
MKRSKYVHAKHKNMVHRKSSYKTKNMFIHTEKVHIFKKKIESSQRKVEEKA